MCVKVFSISPILFYVGLKLTNLKISNLTSFLDMVRMYNLMQSDYIKDLHTALDNADCIAKDLVGAGLIDGKNLVVGQ